MSRLLASERAWENIQYDPLESLDDLVRAQRSKGNDVVDLSGSVNRLMAEELERYAEKNINPSFGTVSSYLTNETVSALKVAISEYISTYFHPSTPVEPSNLVITNGVTSLLNMIGFATCEAGDSILCPTPMYSGFREDLASRNDITLVEVSIEEHLDQFAEANSKILVSKLEAAYQQAKEVGTTIRALLICNPSNPLGRCYSRQSLVALARFCSRHSLHLISDEIYAMSVFTPQQEADGNVNGFTSTLNICHDAGVDVNGIHVLYGASKDFGLGGLRLGVLITRNHATHAVCAYIRPFAGISSFSASFFASLLADTAFLDRHMTMYQARLGQAHSQATSFLHQHDIPFNEANAGLFLWLDLSRWQQHLRGQNAVDRNSKDMMLARWLIEKGVYIRPGEVFSSPVSGHFRLCYTYGDSIVMKGLKRLVNALRELESR